MGCRLDIDDGNGSQRHEPNREDRPLLGESLIRVFEVLALFEPTVSVFDPRAKTPPPTIAPAVIPLEVSPDMSLARRG